MPIEHVTGWLFRVARNRITDLFRKKKPVTFSEAAIESEAQGVTLRLEDLLPSPDAGPDAVYVRNVLLAELEDALDELPAEQRDVFVAHELEGRSFKQLSAESGVSVNTLLSRKRYAVLHLRERLQDVRDEFWTEMKEHVMRKKWMLDCADWRSCGMAAFIWIGGELVMHLWNWLAPTVVRIRPASSRFLVGVIMNYDRIGCCRTAHKPK